VSPRIADYAALSVVGLELEYAIVDERFRPACLVESALRAASGRSVSDVVMGSVGFSNELAQHVLEVKSTGPQADLRRLERDLLRGVRYLSRLLRDRFDARLMPTGMHPLMRPRETRLWQRDGRHVYDAYARVFNVQTHGWLNVQSTHVNLPFGRSDRDVVALYNAVACLLPYLPALAASSPYVEGRPGKHVDNRLAFYRANQRRIPVITGAVVPEFIASLADYRTRVLRPIFDALGEVPGAKPLRHEWVNSRGAILRFDRRALEIRILDIQECVRMDVAFAAFVRGTLRWVVRALADGEMKLPAHAMLVRDLKRVISAGRAARVEARHLRNGRAGEKRAGDVLEAVLDRSLGEMARGERDYLALVARRLSRGSLSELIAKRLRRTRTRDKEACVRAVYEELMDALEHNEPWQG
jgi:carboxylate-amine ligase